MSMEYSYKNCPSDLSRPARSSASIICSRIHQEAEQVLNAALEAVRAGQPVDGPLRDVLHTADSGPPTGRTTLSSSSIIYSSF
jgi:hypothetical protein